MMPPGLSSAILRIAFLGTNHPAVPTLRALAEKGWIAVVVMPAEAGEKNDELLKIVKEFSLDSTYELCDLERYAPNLLVAANYPKLVPARYLEAFPCINTHWGLLPRWRGVHPTAWALINGDKRIGLTVHLMGHDFDVGPILTQESVEVTEDLTLLALHRQLAGLQAQAVVRVLEHYRLTGELPATAQDEDQATYVPQRLPEDGRIDWAWPTPRIVGLVRALPTPQYPGAFTYLERRKLVIHSAAPVAGPAYFSTPGQVVRVQRTGAVWIKTGDTCVAVHTVSFDDEQGRPRPAREVLKRGMKLGIDAQAEVLRLSEEVEQLRVRIARLLDGAEAIR